MLRIPLKSIFNTITYVPQYICKFIKYRVKRFEVIYIDDFECPMFYNSTINTNSI